MFRAFLLALALTAFGTVAQAATPHSIGAHLGLAAPGSDLADVVGTGFLIGADYEYRINPRFGAGLDVNYFSLGEKSTSTLRFGYPLTVKTSAPGGQAILFGRYYVPTKSTAWSPYVMLGLEKVPIGLKSTTTYRGSTSTSKNRQDKPGFGLGVGVNHPMNEQLRVGAELGYHTIQTSGYSARLITLALSGSYGLGQ